MVTLESSRTGRIGVCRRYWSVWNTGLCCTEQSHVFLVKSGDMAGEFLTFLFAAEGAVTGFTAAGIPFRRLVEASNGN